MIEFLQSENENGANGEINWITNASPASGNNAHYFAPGIIKSRPSENWNNTFVDAIARVLFELEMVHGAVNVHAIHRVFTANVDVDGGNRNVTSEM